MALANMKDLIDQAAKGGYGIGAFSVSNMEMIMGVIRAAEELKSPVILQVTQPRLLYSPLSLIGPLMVAAAKASTVPVAVHLDHGTDLQGIEDALELGFTSVMIDASKYPLADNIGIVKKVTAMAKQYAASVESEIGTIGGSEGWAKNDEIRCSNPLHVKQMYEETGVDAIAISIGNAHGVYTSEPKLDFAILEECRRAVPVPLVLHGGSGISEEDFKRCIKQGISKVNIATASYQGAMKEVAKTFLESEKIDFFAMSSAIVQGVKANAVKHIEIFESAGKA